MTDAEVLADTEGSLEAAFNDSVLLTGRACRDTFTRLCAWHVERGMELPVGVRCNRNE